jgi:hypothetical protein
MILWLIPDVAWDSPGGSLYNDFPGACAARREILRFWRQALAVDEADDADHPRPLSEYPPPSPHRPIESCRRILAVFRRTYTIGALPRHKQPLSSAFSCHFNFF